MAVDFASKGIVCITYPCPGLTDAGGTLQGSFLAVKVGDDNFIVNPIIDPVKNQNGLNALIKQVQLLGKTIRKIAEATITEANNHSQRRKLRANMQNKLNAVNELQASMRTLKAEINRLTAEEKEHILAEYFGSFGNSTSSANSGTGQNTITTEIISLDLSEFHNGFITLIATDAVTGKPTKEALTITIYHLPKHKKRSTYEIPFISFVNDSIYIPFENKNIKQSFDTQMVSLELTGSNAKITSILFTAPGER